MGLRRGEVLSDVSYVRVGSLNGPKIEAVRSALAPYSPEVEVEGVDVESGVPEQPVGYPEIVAGARNRAREAFARGAHARGSWGHSGDAACDLAVGIEDGLVEVETDAASGRAIVNVGCAVVTDGRSESLGFSSAFAYPPNCAAPAVVDRAPIGGIFDRAWAAYTGETGAAVPSGRTSGNIGRLTLGVLPRADYARHAVLCALVPFLHPSLYAPASESSP